MAAPITPKRLNSRLLIGHPSQIFINGFRDVSEFVENLEADAPALREQRGRDLGARIVFRGGIDEDVGVEEDISAHWSRRG